MAASLRSLAAFAAMFVCVSPGRASALPGPATPLPSLLQRESPVLEGIVLEGEAPLGGGTVVLHRVRSDTLGSGEVFDTAEIGPAGDFRFALPSVPDADFAGDIYFASVDYDGVVYFGPAITTIEQLDSLYVVRVYEAEEVPPEGVSLTVEVRTMFIEFAGDEWVVTDLFAIDNRGTRTLVARDDGVVWSYPLPRGATRPELGEGDLTPDAITFEGGRVLVSAPLPPGDRVIMIRYRLENLGATIPAPGRTEVFEMLVKEPAPPIRVAGLEPVDVVALAPGSSYRRYGGSELSDLSLTIVETQEGRPPPVEWLAVLTALMLATGGFLAYAYPRGPMPVGVGPGLAREALILEAARLDDALAEPAEPAARTELLARRAALLSLLRNAH